MRLNLFVRDWFVRDVGYRYHYYFDWDTDVKGVEEREYVFLLDNEWRGGYFTIDFRDVLMVRVLPVENGDIGVVSVYEVDERYYEEVISLIRDVRRVLNNIDAKWPTDYLDAIIDVLSISLEEGDFFNSVGAMLNECFEPYEENIYTLFRKDEILLSLSGRIYTYINYVDKVLSEKGAASKHISLNRKLSNISHYYIFELRFLRGGDYTYTKSVCFDIRKGKVFIITNLTVEDVLMLKGEWEEYLKRLHQKSYDEFCKCYEGLISIVGDEERKSIFMSMRKDMEVIREIGMEEIFLPAWKRVVEVVKHEY